MRPPKLRAWNQELKMMIQNEEIFTRDNIYMLLNTSDDYIWMRAVDYKDKNGVEVYEGDILVNKHGNSVIYHQLHNQTPIRAITRSTVIGNIYQNPELMENKNVEQFDKDIRQGLKELQAGEIEPYKFGEGNHD